jgi:hypothetical protein
MAVSSWWPVALTTPVLAGRDLKSALVDGKAAQNRGDYEEAEKIYSGGPKVRVIHLIIMIAEAINATRGGKLSPETSVALANVYDCRAALYMRKMQYKLALEDSIAANKLEPGQPSLC